ncbi:MAG: hypothetical protein AAGB32_01835 [Pseudomonadota bacterium]
MSKPYLDYNTLKGGNRSGYPCAFDAWAIVVKGLPVTRDNLAGSRMVEIGHDKNVNERLKVHSKRLGLPIGQP